MPELLNEKLSDQEFHSKLSNGFDTPEAEDKYWDMITDAIEDDYKKSRYHTETPAPAPAPKEYTEAFQTPDKPIAFPDSDQLLIDEGNPEPRLEAHNEVHSELSFEDPAYAELTAEPEAIDDEDGIIERGFQSNSAVPPNFESPEPVAAVEFAVETPAPKRTAPRHAAEYHEEDDRIEQEATVEAKESITMDERFMNLLQSANDIIDRRKAAAESGDKSSSIDDFESFFKLYTQYEAEGLEKESLERIANLVTATYDYIDRVPQEVAPAPSVIETEAPVQLEVQAEPVAEQFEEAIETPEIPTSDVEMGEFRFGDRVRTYVQTENGPQFEDNWRVSDYVIDEATNKVALYTLKASDGRILRNVTEYDLVSWRDAELEPVQEAPIDSEAALHANPGAEQSISDEELDGIDDVSYAESNAEVVGATEVIDQQLESEVSMIPETSRLERFKKWWGRNRKAAKEPHGMKFMGDRWPDRVNDPYTNLPTENAKPAITARRSQLETQMGNDREKHANSRRRLYLLGASAALAVGVGAGAVAVSSGGVDAITQSPSPTPTETLPSGVSVEDAGSESGPADTIKKIDSPEATDTKPYVITRGETGIELFEKLGLTATDWFNTKNELLALDANKDQFYLAGDDVRLNHEGELAKPIQNAINKKFNL